MSRPRGSFIFYADVAHLVERHLAKVEVASSSLVIRSIFVAFSARKKEKQANGLFPFFGADYGARTRHLDLGKVALYQMS